MRVSYAVHNGYTQVSTVTALYSGMRIAHLSLKKQYQSYSKTQTHKLTSVMCFNIPAGMFALSNTVAFTSPVRSMYILNPVTLLTRNL